MKFLARIVVWSEYVRFKLVLLLITALGRIITYLMNNHINYSFVDMSRYKKYREKLDKVMEEHKEERR